MQIITRQEAEERLSSKNNLLNRISNQEVDIVQAEDAEEGESDVEVLTPIEEEKHQALLAQILALPDSPTEKRKRGQRGKQIPDFVREAIAVEAHLVPNKEVSKEYAVAPSMTSEFKRGRVGGEEKPELIDAIEQSLSKVRKVAERKLFKALRLIDNESLASLNAVQLASVASQMSKIMDNSIPARLKNREPENPNQPQFIVYAPALRTEAQYKQLEVGD